MPKKTKEEIFAMTIASFDLASATGNSLVRAYMSYEDAHLTLSDFSGANLSWSAQKQKERDELTRCKEDITLAQLVAAGVGAPEPFAKKLIELGLTRLDWLELPQYTVTLAAQKKLSKEEWLSRPISLLGTLSGPALRDIAQKARGISTRWWERAPEVTLQQLFECEMRLGNYWQSVTKTRDLLYRLGFRYEDSWFMQFGTQQAFVEKLKARHKLSPRMAKRVHAIAEKEGWVLRRDVRE